MGVVEISISAAPDGTVFLFNGVVDEDVNFDSLPADGSGVLIFDLGGVRLINSVGIRNWILWMKRMRDRSFIFRRVARAIIDQVNVINGFLPPICVVESFFVPYYCESCENAEQILFTQGKEFTRGTADVPEKVNAPQNVVCPKCRATMEMDVIEQNYFKFLRYRR